MDGQRTNYGLGIFALAATLALLTVGSGCEGAGAARESAASLLGTIGERFERFRGEDGRLSLANAAEVLAGQQLEGEEPGDRPAAEEGVPSEEPTEEPTEPADPPADEVIDAAAEFRGACEVVVNSVIEHCPALDLPELVDVQAVVSDCAAFVDGVVAVEAAIEVRAMSSEDIWLELTAGAEWIEEACTEGIDLGEQLEDAYDRFEEEYGDDVGQAYEDLRNAL